MSEIITEGIIEARALRQWAETFTAKGEGNSELVREVRAHFNDDGIQVRAVDPANIAMMGPTTLHARAFESYDSPGSATVGMDLTTLQDRISHADDDDLVKWAVDMETRHLKLEYGPANVSMTLIDPESVRQEPDIPDLDLSNTIVMKGRDFAKAVDIVSMVSNHIFVHGNPEDRYVTFQGEGDTDDAKVTYGDEELIDASVTEHVTSLFNNNYISAFADPIPADAEVTITFGDEFPMVVEWEALDGGFEVCQTVAPRIRSD